MSMLTWWLQIFFVGSIDREEIIESFKRLGVVIDPNEADKLLSK